ncbi:phosphoglucosamine mutase [Candidatus Tenderia electrophaga]|jgi:phosphoglucosamine mutase|uniref:Phosphoglucosamine mutase n=1 Tax=Candidatus Tenderia electrophaga TaxID=1748243 RepID=A0A0S2TCE4_9GAMM|nr:phosphoglucosamine mutase [Candidatus Tenderia electrophaga]
MAGERKYFGTDGVRGEVGQFPITPEFIMKLGWAAGRVLAQCEGDQSKVVIGKDTRISGYMFESALEAGLSAAGVDIMLLGPMPTPGIAYLTRTLRAEAGIVISASHNPHYDNGIKFFSAQGLKLADEVELAIEAELDKPMETVASSRLGKAARVIDAAGRYIEFCKSTIPSRISLNGLKIVVDCAHGATYDIAPKVFDELEAQVIEIGTEPNGLNINQACGSTHPAELQQRVLDEEADLGIALDGDGDRVIMVDHKGEIVDGDEILYIIACASIDKPDFRAGVVGTLMSNLGLEHALTEKGICLHRAQVGDRYVMEMLQRHNLLLGGESSGHIICLERTTTGDGIVSALQVLAAMVERDVSLHELKSGMTKYPQTMINVRTAQRFDFSGSAEVAATQREIESQLNGRGRVLLRASGTEPVIRVMVEGQDADEVDECARHLAQKVEAAYQSSHS